MAFATFPTFAVFAAMVLSLAGLPAPAAGATTHVGRQPTTEVTVVRRGTAAPLTGAVDRLDERGIVLVTDETGRRTVPWYQIRDVVRERGAALDARVTEWIDVGTQIWRARRRLERGDPLLAEPILEALFPSFLGRTDEMSLVVAEGLLRCRLARGDHGRAVIPSLEVARLRWRGMATNAYGILPPVMDGPTGLVPALPPVFDRGVDRARLGAELDVYVAEMEQRVRTRGNDEAGQVARDVLGLARAWRAAVGETPARPRPADSDVAPSTDAERILRRWIRVRQSPVRAATFGPDEAWAAASVPDDPATVSPDAPEDDGVPGDLAAAQAILEAGRADDRPVWLGIWVDAAWGLAAIDATSEVVQQRGLVRLLSIPAAHGPAAPYLCGVVLATVADRLDASGDPDGAAAVRADFARRFPGHPSLPRTESTDA